MLEFWGNTTLRVQCVFLSIATHLGVISVLAIARATHPLGMRTPFGLRWPIQLLSLTSAFITLLTPYPFENADPLIQCGIRVVCFFYAFKQLHLGLVTASYPPTMINQTHSAAHKGGRALFPAPMAKHRDKVAYAWALLTEMRYHSFDIHVQQKGRTALKTKDATLWTYGPLIALPALAYLIPSPATQCAVLLLVIQHALEGLHTILHPHCPDKVFYRPFAAGSLGEFWGTHWQACASPWLRALAYRPVRKLTGSQALAVLATFSLTGLWHAYAAAPISDTPWVLGLQVWAWFVSLAIGCLVERALFGERQGGMVQRVCVWAFALLGAGVCWRTAQCSCRYDLLRADCG